MDHPTPWRIALMFVFSLALAAWPWAASGMNCLASALYLVPLWIALGMASAEAAGVRRVAFITRYLEPRGRLGGLLRPGLLMLSLQTIKSLLLVLLLVTGIMALAPLQRGILAADALLLSLLSVLLRHLLAGEVRADLCAPLLRQWAHRCNAFILWIALLSAAWHVPYPDYADMAWRQVLQRSVADVQPGCDALALLGRVQAVAEAMSAWAMQNLSAETSRLEQTMPAWLLVLAVSGVSFLIAWLHSRVLTGVLSRPWCLWQKGGTGT